ncbi:LytTR family DNA-binding domain-containing protein [Enterococcus faecium]|uniref:LytR/AlgR family response regulator transcription factor n=1 Tax=Enterococcus faecium TaxID=1352 RepID=UPI000BF18E53|nr:LytTR family transcriptional regulator DNA-binding domain-containing protein [Enterococcus faecium]PEH49550.1 hypothetical protein CRM75_01985 [Enterococcus faecium]
MNIFVLEDDFKHRKYITKQLNQLHDINNWEIFPLDLIELAEYYWNIDNKNILDNDIFIIDIKLNNSYSGIDIAEKIRKKNKYCFIIFLSSYESYGMYIINRRIYPHAYISKELMNTKKMVEKFEIELHEIKIKIKKRALNGKNISIPTRQKIFQLDLEKINYIETIKGDRYSVNVHFENNVTIVHKDIGFFRKELTGFIFFKELKSYILNTMNISKIDKTKSCLIFKNSEVLYLGTKSLRKVYKNM